MDDLFPGSEGRIDMDDMVTLVQAKVCYNLRLFQHTELEHTPGKKTFTNRL